MNIYAKLVNKYTIDFLASDFLLTMDWIQIDLPTFRLPEATDFPGWLRLSELVRDADEFDFRLSTFDFQLSTF